MANRATGFQHGLRGLSALGLVLLALAVRLPWLAERPLHTDEAVNAYLIGRVLDGERYVYDPQDRHGPALYALTLPLVRAAGEKSFVALRLETLRLGSVICGVLTILLLLGLAAETGPGAAGLAALLWALAALPVYYSRYFIHETGFVALTLGLILCGRQAARAKSWRWAALAGLCAGAMLAFKETAVLHYAALAVTAAAVTCRNPANEGVLYRWLRSGPLLAVGAAAALLIVLFAFTWAFTDWRGPLDLLRAFVRFAQRAGGEGHAKHAGYYLLLLGGGWAGLPLFALAALGGVWSWRRRHPAGQFFLFYGVAITALYSAIPYKTPWLALNLWLPLCVLAGLGAAALLETARQRWQLAVLAAGGVLVLTALGADLRARVYRDAGGDRNPYAYAHTSEDLLRLPGRVAQLAQQTPAGRNLKIAVVMQDPWPLPWYLREFPRVGFWQPGQEPGAADLYLTTSDPPADLRPWIEKRMPEFFGQRPNALLVLWTPTAAPESLKPES